YVVPRRAVDDILPLEVTPRPAEVERVFVGRVELVTPSTIAAVRTALEQNDVATLRKYGRFLREIGRRLLDGAPVSERARLAHRPDAVSAAWVIPQDVCR